MKQLRERYPTARIDIVLGRRNAAIASLLPAIDSTFVLRPGIGGLQSLRKTLRASNYDVVVNLLAKDSSSGAVLAVLSGARYRVGFEGSLSSIYDFPIPHSNRTTHIVSETSLLLTPFGIKATGASPSNDFEMLELVVDNAPVETANDVGGRDVRVVFSISAPSPARSWIDEKVAETIRELSVDGLTFVVAGLPADQLRLAAIAKACNASVLEPTHT
ncbi:MAG: glycosyltransferase family 9 protein, partial [bacterium]|nr:glycosyltransferase family 9 protein [Candidatus Kapabacteria bacterium]